MVDKTIENAFSETERSALHSLADMFQDREERDQLRSLISEGATITKIVQAYRTQKGVIGFLKAFAGLIVVIGGAAAVLRGSGLWPGK